MKETDVKLKRQAQELFKELREKKKQYQKKLTLIEGLARGEKAILEDRIITHSEAKKRMSRWLD